jgi:hypothetical protein
MWRVDESNICLAVIYSPALVLPLDELPQYFKELTSQLRIEMPLGKTKT